METNGVIDGIIDADNKTSTSNSDNNTESEPKTEDTNKDTKLETKEETNKDTKKDAKLETKDTKKLETKDTKKLETKDTKKLETKDTKKDAKLETKDTKKLETKDTKKDAKLETKEAIKLELKEVAELESKKKFLEEFDRLINKNKLCGKNWYYGLRGKWWWGMSEKKAREKLASGKIKIRSKIAITSIIRNEEKSGYLKKFLNCCQKLERYHDIVYIFIEGDSSDKTYDVLQDWLKAKNNYILKKIDRKKRRFVKDHNTERTMYFAELRNILLDLALSIPDISEVLMIDANYGWKGDLVSSLRKTKADIAAPLAVMHKDRNGKRLFYDVWAFRKDGKQFSHWYPYLKGLESGKPMNIDSVGGGYLIKRKVLEAQVKYNGDKDCEHVGFCLDARNKDFTIKINPNAFIRKGGFKHE